MSEIVSIKKVANGSLQGELTDTVDIAGRVNVLAKLNKGDARFNTANLRRAWFPATVDSLLDLGISKQDAEYIQALEEGQKYELSIVDPKIDGEVLRVQVTENVVPDAWQKDHVMKTAKQLQISEQVAKSKIATNYDLKKYLGQNGYFLDQEGNFIFMRTTVTVSSQLTHTIIKDVTFVPEKELATEGATLASPINIKSFEEDLKSV